ncbi:hypothetical protein BGW36DRAFT_364779 [Talaromyces proteolyticus]|uniref:Uncharacterized protein n=1 Tax=Talaromyces proteolyticus TaxID=1131652 RepID=A0AAD4KEG7_9EURO|nr:uncharacterized protein BGW36DRAFT_364779 [Talaromyces proteolyticus]KAH8690048.1 hypothetical protein BGW36DRAFT_364779 [Talaromyces proteolyticus]
MQRASPALLPLLFLLSSLPRPPVPPLPPASSAASLLLLLPLRHPCVGCCFCFSLYFPRLCLLSSTGMPLVGLIGVSQGAPDIPLITGGSRISNLLGSAAPSRPKTQTPAPAIPSGLPRLAASYSSSRTATPSSPRAALPPPPPTFKSRLPLPCKPSTVNAGATLSPAPSPVLAAASSSRFDERRAARDSRSRPWLAGSKLAAKSSSLERATLRPTTTVREPQTTDPRLDDRRRARQDRDRPWLPKGRVSPAPRPISPSTNISALSSSAATVPAAAPATLARHSRCGLLKTPTPKDHFDLPRPPTCRRVFFAWDETVIDVEKWIDPMVDSYGLEPY